MFAYFLKGREPLNSYTHFWGAVAGLVGTAVLAARCLMAHAGGMILTGCLLFGLSLVALYTASCVYHFALCGGRQLARLRKMDHAMIYLLIAGTYTPICVRFMERQSLLPFLAAIWGVALVGVLLKVLWLGMPRALSTALYVGMGWALLADWPAFAALRGGGLALVAAGGVLYTVGALVYLFKWPSLGRGWGSHELFHLFVLAGSACHFVAVFCYVV